MLMELIERKTKEKSKQLNDGLYGLDPKKAYEEIMNGTREIGHNDMFKVKLVIHRELIFKRGIRKPEQILEDMRTTTTPRKDLNGKQPDHAKSGPDNAIKDLDFYHDVEILKPHKPSLNL